MENEIAVDEVVIKGVTYVPKVSLQNLETEINDVYSLIGKNYVFRSVTNYFVGTVVKIIDKKYVVLNNSVWVADCGYLTDFIKNGDYKETEVVGNSHIVNLDTVVDIFPWVHKIPKMKRG